MNVLGKIVIPRTKNTIKYILLELEELEREDVFKLKCVLKNKKKQKTEDEKDKEKDKEKEEPKNICPVCKKDIDTHKDLLKKSSPQKIPSVPEILPAKISSVTITAPHICSPKTPISVEEPKPSAPVSFVEELITAKKSSVTINNKAKTLPEATVTFEELKPSPSFYEELIPKEKSSIYKVPLNFPPPVTIPPITESVISRVLGLVDRADTKDAEKLKQLLSAITSMSKQLFDKGTQNIDFVPFIKTCNEAITQLGDELHKPRRNEIDNQMKLRLQQLKGHIRNVIDITEQFKADTLLSPSVDNFLDICNNVNNKINLYLSGEVVKIIPQTNSKLEHLKDHIKQVENVTREYETDGLLSSSVEDFYHSCEEFISKINKYTQKEKRNNQLDTVKSKVIDLEHLTKFIKTDEFASKSVENFIKSCREFQSKLDVYNQGQKIKTVTNPIVEKLKGQIDETISLTKKVGTKGLISESIPNFIKSCEHVKQRLEPEKKEPTILDELKSNINSMMKSINKYKQYGLVSESVDDFIRTCELAKAKIYIYETLTPDELDNELIPVCSEFCICSDLDEYEPGENCDESEVKKENKKQTKFNEIPPCDSCKDILSSEHSQELLKTEAHLEATHSKETTPQENQIKPTQVINASSQEENQSLRGFNKEKVNDLYDNKDAKSVNKISEDSDEISKNPETICKMCEDVGNILSENSEIVHKMSKDSEIIHKMTEDLNMVLKIIEDREMLHKMPNDPEMLPKMPNDPEMLHEISNNSKSEAISTVSIDPEPHKVDSNLGLFETIVRKITRVTRSQNLDGTVSEQTETIVLKEERHDPNETNMGDDDYYVNDDVTFEELLQEGEEIPKIEGDEIPRNDNSEIEK